MLHYTKPGDIVFDGFCGTGMTGVAAQMCGDYSTCFSVGETDTNNIGSRHVIVADLLPEAVFIAHNYNSKVDILKFKASAERIIAECKRECGWVYETDDISGGLAIKGTINYTTWSEVYVCPHCSQEVVYWESAVKKMKKKVSKSRYVHTAELK